MSIKFFSKEIHFLKYGSDEIDFHPPEKYFCDLIHARTAQSIHFEQQPLPDYVDVIFEFSIGQLKAEADWLVKTLAYMETKPWYT